MQNKAILLTWWTWFLWSHILEAFVNEGNRVILLKRSSSDILNISWIIDKVQVYNIDTLKDIEYIFQSEKINIIVHTATDYGRRECNFTDIIEVNLKIPLLLLELWVKYEIDAFINTDTFWDENIDLPIWLSYYVHSKKDFLKYAKKLIENRGTRLINMKLEHLYWPRDKKQKFIPYIISSLLENTAELDLTGWEQKKDFLYVKDALSAYMYIVNNLSKIKPLFEEFELWSGNTLSIKDLILWINKVIKSNTVFNFWKIPYRKWEPMESKADIDKLHRFGWMPTYTIENGMIETIAYFQSLK